MTPVRRVTPAAIVLMAGIVLTAGLSRAEVPYRAEIRGVPERELREKLQKVSQAFSLKDHPPATIGQLQRRAKGDEQSMRTVLQSEGYYAAEVETELEPSESGTLLLFRVQRGALFQFRQVTLEYVGQEPGQALPPDVPLRLDPGEEADAAEVANEERYVVAALKREGYPFAKPARRSVRIDRDAARIDLVIRIDPGPIARYGPVTVSGLKDLDERFVRRRIDWRRGRTFDAKRLQDLEEDLVRMGMFSSVRITLGDELDPDGELPILIDLRERRPRSIRLGVNYRSDVGLGGRVSWQHRNLFGGGENLDISFEGSELEYVQQSVFTRHDFLRPRQALVVDVRIAEERPDAYISRNVQSSVALVPRLSRELRLMGGVGYRFGYVEQFESDRYSILGLLSGVMWDSREDRLDPDEGQVMGLSVVPSADTSSDLRFLQSVFEGRTFYPLRRHPRLIAAFRLQVGSIGGAEQFDIPADLRFYSGGGGSVRGYEYQTIGPIVEGVPVGGIGQLELSVELRSQMTRTLGAVLFADGGQVYDKPYPTPDRELQWGAGVGARIYTPMGPLRLDVAFPLNRRDIDDSFQFYLSVGQAF